MGYIEKVSTDMSRKALKMGYRSADIMYMSRTKIKVGHKRRNIVHMSQTKTKPGHKRRNIVYMSQTKTKLGQRKEDIVYMSSNVRHRTWYLYEENIYRKEKKMENHTIVTLKKEKAARSRRVAHGFLIMRLIRLWGHLPMEMW